MRSVEGSRPLGVTNIRQAQYQGVAGEVVTFAYTVVDDDADANGVSIAADSLANSSGGSIRDSANLDADLTHSALADDEDTGVDAVAPLLLSAAADFEELLLTYSEALDEGQTPSPGEFTATAGADDLTVVAVQVLGSRVTLTLTPPVAAGDTVTVSYSGASAMSHLRDPTGNPAADFA